MESPESESLAGGIALDFMMSPATPFKLPPRLRQRLDAECRTPCTVEEIQTKLRHADLRRQQFYDKVSTKARPKPRSPTQFLSNDDHRGQRLEAKLQAAEQKRLSLLAKAQKRLARLNELRQAAKTGVEMRFERERQKLGTKVELRVQQAEANRVLIVKAYRQRRATLKERSSQSLLRRVARERKYKERVRAAIHQKRMAAEKKRLGFLEEEKNRARARMLQVQQVTTLISHQREVERRRLRDQLEHRLQRAKRQRAEYLQKRGRHQNYLRVKWIRLQEQADLLSRKLARCWRRFCSTRKTTFNLAKSFVDLNIHEKNVKLLPFEQLAILIESPATLRTVKALLDRLETRFKLSRSLAPTDHLSSFDDIDHLLRRVVTPKKKTALRTSMRGRDVKKVSSHREGIRSPTKLSRYPVRIVLCAYMVLGHPDAVFSCLGEREIALAKSAEEFVREFDLVSKIIVEGPIRRSDEESDSTLQKPFTFRSQLATFDKAWSSYLNCFVVWKAKDAQFLEEDLVRAACQLELSMIQKCKRTREGDNDSLTHDLKAIQKQVAEDQKLIREKIKHLSGDAGVERMECALSKTRSDYFQAKETGSQLGLPVLTVSSSDSPSTSHSDSSSPVAFSDKQIDAVERPNGVVRVLFREHDGTSSTESYGSSSDKNNVQLNLSSTKQLYSENEATVNELLHDQHIAALENINSDEDKNVKEKIKETMEKAFWDSIILSMKQDEPNYDRIVQLMMEVRDELCEMAPQSWKEGIFEAINLEIFSQIVASDNLDMNYLQKILEFALVTLQKLSSPASDDEMKAAQLDLLNELSDICQATDDSKYSNVLAMIEGLRFALKRIQALKGEISKARIRMMIPLLKGPVGFDYLREAFTSRYGSPDGALESMPLTLEWVSSVWTCKDQEWVEHSNLFSPLISHESRDFLPTAILRTGVNLFPKTNINKMNASPLTGNIRECEEEGIELSVRLCLLKLVTKIDGLSEELLPETFKLNYSRLRAVQAHVQKIIVISTSLLVLRQILISERVADIEIILSKCTEHVCELLNKVENVSIEEIVDVMFRSWNEYDISTNNSNPKKVVMARMLAKSLQAGDAVFEKVSRAVYVSTRGVILGGSGPRGRKLCETALRQVGAADLIERVVGVARVLDKVATVSVSVHGLWYKKITESL